MENFNIFDIPKMENTELAKLVNGLQETFKTTQNNFALTCLYVYQICDYYDKLCHNTGKAYALAKDKLNYSAYTLLEKFGFDRNMVSKLKRSYITYCQGTLPTSVSLEMWAEGFSPSKLFEMLLLEKRYLIDLVNRKELRPNMTVKEIRQAIKQIRGETENKKLEGEEINEAEIPMAYDPTKEYEFEYFKSKEKPALLNIIMTLQDAYQKLKKKKK